MDMGKDYYRRTGKAFLTREAADKALRELVESGAGPKAYKVVRVYKIQDQQYWHPL